MSAQRSIVIGGGAFAGLALAVALRQGLGADIPVDRGRSGAGHTAEPRSARDRHRRGLPAAVRSHRGVGARSRTGAADPRHGGHQFQAGGRDPSGVPDLCRRCRAGRAVRAYGRKPPSDRCAGQARRGRRHRSAADRGDLLRFARRRHRGDAGRRQRDRSQPAGGGRRRALEVARARRHRHPWLGL